jgi:hypothetical protein
VALLLAVLLSATVISLVRRDTPHQAGSSRQRDRER